MKWIVPIVLVLALIFVDCKKKEEEKTTEEPVASVDSDPIAEEEGIPRREEIANPTIPSPKGLRNLFEVRGDLDGDKEEELVIIYETSKDSDLGFEREIRIFKKKDEKWELLYKNIDAILPSRAGGMLGDPFEDVKVENNALVVNHFGGAREKWHYTHRYRFQKDGWFLIGATTSFFAPCEISNTYDYNLSTGKVNVSNEIQACDENGEPKGKPKTKTTTITLPKTDPISMDGFTPGNTEVKIPNTKDQSFYF